VVGKAKWGSLESPTPNLMNKPHITCICGRPIDEEQQKRVKEFCEKFDLEAFLAGADEVGEILRRREASEAQPN
jgi:hypothetical protein